MQVRGRPLGLVLIVAYKLVWGVAEVLAGAFVHKAPGILRAQVAQDPQDQFANWILAHTNLEPEHLRAITFGLLTVGLFKLVLAGGIWYRSWLVRDIALWVMGIGGLFAIGALVSHFTLVRLVVLAIDLSIVAYLWRFLPRHLPPREHREPVTV
jgi:uncharacterized membrane protein (DUF2068 family)